MKGSQVADVQAMLAALELLPQRSVTEGVYDQGTAEAVREFQKRVGIRVDGIVGPQTYTALVLFHHAKTALRHDGTPLALSIAWHESGFLPRGETPYGRGPFMLPGAPRIPLSVGPQPDAEVQEAKPALVAHFGQAMGRLLAVSAKVHQLVRLGHPLPEGTPTLLLRLAALGYRLQRFPGCLVKLLQHPDAVAAGHAWPALVRAAATTPDPACQTAYATAIGNGYVDRVMETAARYASILGLSPAPYLGSSRATTRTSASPPNLPPAIESTAQPRDELPQVHDKIPVTASVPPIPRAPTQPAIPTKGEGGGMGIGLLILGGLALWALGGSRGRRTRR